MVKNGVSIIIPTYNEEKCIIKTLEDIRKKIDVVYEIIVVDDSNDKTEKLVREYIQHHKEIKFIKNKPQNKGFVPSLLLGVKAASKDFIVMVMGDMCDNPNTINVMYEKALEGWDIVCGSRYIKGGGRIGGPEILGHLSQYLCLISYFLTGISTHDVTNSFKMYRKKLLQQLKFNPNSGTAISMELVYQAFFKGARITEIPTVWRGRGETRFQLRQRGPRYFKILAWALENRLRQIFGLRPNDF